MPFSSSARSQIAHGQLGFWAKVTAPKARFLALCGLVLCAFAMGGSSRVDTASLIILRPLSFLFLAYSFLAWRLESPKEALAPVWMLGMLVVILALQLIPLPAALWQSLPGREVIAEIDAAVLNADVWRPISMAPSRTLNTLFALAVPVAAITLCLQLAQGSQDKVGLILVVAGFVSASLALLQVLGPESGPLYTYRITNEGMAVGLFANRNHNAVFLASLIPMVAGLALRAQGNYRTFLRISLSGAAIFFLMVTFATGSRAGSALVLVSIGVSAGLILLAQRNERALSLKQWPAWLKRAIVIFAGLAGAAILLLFFTSEAYDRFFAASVADELRWQVMPQLLAMIATYFPVGSGFGTFDLIYKINEPDELLSTRYLNHAHNDIIQPLIEGGILAGLLIMWFAIWLVRCGRAAWKALTLAIDYKRSRIPMMPFAWASLILLLSGSLVDYPIRTPAGMAAASLLVFLVAIGGRSGLQASGK